MNDRKAMEAARLARVALRKRPAEAATNTTNSTATISPPPTKKLRLAEPAPTPPRAPPHPTVAQPPPTPSPIQYPHGAIKRTWCLHQSRHNTDDIKLEEVLQRETLTTALLSSWQLDFHWLFPKLPPTAKTILIMHSKHDEDKALWRSQTAQWSKSLRLCFPPLSKGPYGIMHSKLMLLFHATHLRVVVPSANLVAYDWGETGVMENSVFLVDLPRLDVEAPRKAEKQMPFARELVKFLVAQGVDKCMDDPTARSVTSALLNFDFSKTRHLAFVHTIPGQHYGVQEALETGWPMLSRSVSELGCQVEDGEGLEVDYATSSLGALTPERVGEFYDACKGASVTVPTAPAPVVKKNTASSKGQKTLSFTPAPTSTNTAQTAPLKPLHPQRPQLRIHYPTYPTILASAPNAGPPSAGTITLSPSTWTAPTFPRTHMHNHTSTRGPGVLSHNKLIYARARKHAWVYTGSANFSPSAWGTLSFVKGRGEVAWRAVNWECGVLVRVAGGGGDAGANVDVEGMGDSESTDEEARQPNAGQDGDDESTDSEAIFEPGTSSTDNPRTSTHSAGKTRRSAIPSLKEKHRKLPKPTKAATPNKSGESTNVLPITVFEDAGVPVPFLVPDSPYISTNEAGEERCEDPWMGQV